MISQKLQNIIVLTWKDWYVDIWNWQQLLKLLFFRHADMFEEYWKSIGLKFLRNIVHL